MLDYAAKPGALRPYIKPDSADAPMLKDLLGSVGIETNGRPLSEAVTEFQTRYNQSASKPIGVDGKAGSETLAALQKQVRNIDQADMGGALTTQPRTRAFLDTKIDNSGLNAPAPQGSVSGSSVASASRGSGPGAARAMLERQLDAKGQNPYALDPNGVKFGKSNPAPTTITDNPTFAMTPELKRALDAKDQAPGMIANKTAAPKTAQPSQTEINDYMAQLQKRAETNHPHNPGYQSSRDAVAAFAKKYPEVAQKGEELYNLQHFEGPIMGGWSKLGADRSERARINDLQVQLGLAPAGGGRTGGVAGH
ncbi:MAG: hypothetical protein U1E65_17990 [Myxococcota bacterium]